MKAKLIVYDLDNTLLHSDNTVSNYTINILKKCSQFGILTAVATSRSEFSAKDYVGLLNPDIIVTSGGAMARYRDTVIYQALIPSDYVNGIIADALQNPNIKCIRMMGTTHEYSNLTGLPPGQKDYGHYDYYDYSTPIVESAWKIQFVTSDTAFLHNLIDRYPSCSLVSYVNEDLHKISHVGANKRDAIISSCKYLNIDPEYVVSFGDDSSDMELIRSVGIGVAVDNAIPSVKAIAKYHCKSNDADGVAEFIEKIILI